MATWSTNCLWPRFAEEAKNGAEEEKEGTKKFCWLEEEGAGLKACEGLKAGGGVLFGLNADRNTSDPPIPSTLDRSKTSLLSLKAAGKWVSEVKSEGEGHPRPLGVPLSFFNGLASHGKPTLTRREGRRELLHKYLSLKNRIRSFADFLRYEISCRLRGLALLSLKL